MELLKYMIISDRQTRIISVFLIAVLVLINTPLVNVRAEETETKFYSVDEKYSFEVDASISSYWDTYANVDFTIRNTGEEKIDNWYITFESPYGFENIWDAEIYEDNGLGTYTIKNAGWNQDILPNHEVTFGVTMNSDSVITELPSLYLLNVETTQVDTLDYEVSYQEYSKWNGGFSGVILIVSNIDVEDWKLIFSSNYLVNNASDASIYTGTDGSVIVEGNSVQNIKANDHLSVSVSGNSTEEDMQFDSVELLSRTVAFGLQEDEDCNGILDYVEYITQKEGEELAPVVIPTEEPIATVAPSATIIPFISTATPTASPTIEPTVTNIPTPTCTPTPTALTAIPSPSISEDSDTDGDGLPDYLENEIGTDLIDIDTDNDEINDMLEYAIGYDPLSEDSDGDGILDSEEDYDEDGLSNIEEIDLKTLLYIADGDFDGLNDREELRFGTDPYKYDSDDDGISDGDEVCLGKDPKDDSDGLARVIQTKSLYMTSSENNAISQVDVTIELADNIEKSLKIVDLADKNTPLAELDGCVGSPIEFESNEEFDRATVKFYYDESKLGNVKEDNLMLFWYDEEAGFPKPQNQAVIDKDANTITAELSHFSIYFIYDGESLFVQYDYPEYEIVSHESDNLDLCIVLEDNPYMSDSDRIESVDVANKIIDSLTESDRASIIILRDEGVFDPKTETTYLCLCNYQGKKVLKEFISEKYPTESYDGSSCDALVNTAIYASYAVLNRSGDIGNTRRVVQITNGRSAYYWNPLFYSDTYIKKDAHVPYYAVQVGDSEEDNWLKKEWCISTGGAYYLASNISAGYLIVDARDTGYGYNDFDGDGLYDHLEIDGLPSLLIEKIYKTSIDTDDLDGDGIVDGFDSDCDGLSDGEEMGKMYEVKVDEEHNIIISANGKEVARYKDYIESSEEFTWFNRIIPSDGTVRYGFAGVSSPLDKDTDKDDITDNKDAYPNKKNEKKNLLLFSSDLYVEDLDSVALMTSVYNWLDFLPNNETTIIQSVSTVVDLKKTVVDNYVLPDGKIFTAGYNIVALVAHANNQEMYFSSYSKEFDTNFNVLDMQHLSGVPIDNLFFDGCNTANFGNGKDCLAKRAISELENVKYVFGWYGTANAIAGIQWGFLPRSSKDRAQAGLWRFSHDNLGGDHLSTNKEAVVLDGVEWYEQKDI